MSSPTEEPTPTDVEQDAPTTNGTTDTAAIPTASPAKPATPPPPPPEPIDAEACKEAGNKFFKAQNFPAAIEQYSKAISADPKNPVYLSNRAAAYMQHSKYALALNDCALADRLQPSVNKTLLRLSRVLTGLGRPDEALDALERGTFTATDKLPAQTMMAHVKSAENSLGNSQGSMAMYALDRAEALLGPGCDIPKKWRLLRGEANLKLGNINSLGEAQNIVLSLLRKNAKDPDALVLRGRILYAQGENGKASQHFQEALRCDPDFTLARSLLKTAKELERKKEEGNIAFKKRDWESARTLYTEALEVDPENKGTNAKLFQNRAITLMKLKLYTEAITDCDAAIKLDPNYIKARQTRALALGESGNWEEAVRELKSLQEANPGDTTLAQKVADAQLELKKSKRKDYYKILGIDKDANEQQIKKAYRQMAIKWHPDKNPNNDEADARFKDIGEAYETLSDSQKRYRYDTGADIEPEPGEMFGGGMGGMGGGIDPSVFFAAMGGGGFPGGGGHGHGGFSGMNGGFPQQGGGRNRGNPFGF